MAEITEEKNKKVIFWRLLTVAFLASVLTFYLFYLYLVKNAGVWATSQFLPILTFLGFIFFLNTILSLLVARKKLILAFAFNVATISVDILFLLVLFLTYRNPNG